MDEIIGYEDIIGSDVAYSGADDELEALMAISGAAPLAPAVQPRAVRVQQRPATRRREYPLGFTSTTTVAAGAIASIQAQPQVIFRGERFIVPSDIAGAFDLINILVGKNSQLVSPTAIPCRTFSETGVGVRMTLDTAQVSQIITLQVQNVSGAAVIFRATLIGTCVE